MCETRWCKVQAVVQEGACGVNRGRVGVLASRGAKCYLWSKWKLSGLNQHQWLVVYIEAENLVRTVCKCRKPA